MAKKLRLVTMLHTFSWVPTKQSAVTCWCKLGSLTTTNTTSTDSFSRETYYCQLTTISFTYVTTADGGWGRYKSAADTESSRGQTGGFWLEVACWVPKATLSARLSSPVLAHHNGLTWITLASEELPALAATPSWCKSSLVMMKTMEEELKVTRFLGRSLLLHVLDMTIGRMGRSTRGSGRSLRLRCSQESREQSNCSKQRRNWEKRMELNTLVHLAASDGFSHTHIM